MSLLSSDSRITLLNDDVLEHIFHLNAYTPDIDPAYLRLRGKDISISALDTTRHTSQVCRSWRQLIVQSPTMWANIINLGPLTKASEEWIKEVLRRTGGLKLSISGPMTQSPTPPFIVSLLEENWDRVRHLDLFIVEPNYRDKRFRDIFWKRPAPSLEKFIMQGEISSFEAIRKDGVMLFAGSAPMLRHIRFPSLRFVQNVAWLPQLLSLTLASQSKLSDTLNVVAHCPRLQSLNISLNWNDPGPVEQTSWTEEIHLPYLRQLSLSCNATESLILLSIIIPRTDCALTLSTSKPPAELQSSETFQHLLQIFWHYARVYFDTYRPSELTINISDYGIGIYTKASYRHPKFSFWLHPARHKRIDGDQVDEILAHLSRVTLNTIHGFEFTLSRNSSWCLKTPTSIQIFRSLTSIRKMTLTPSALFVLNDLSDSVTRYPDLVEVTMVDTAYAEGLGPSTELKEGLQLFLSRRIIESGNPLRTLYITPSDDHPPRSDDWVFLSQEFNGLRCFYKYFGGAVEYLCGPTECSEIE